MKKTLLSFTLVLLPMLAKADASGTCGDNLTWTYVEATKTLTISGTGAMTNYSNWQNRAPWINPYRGSIEIVVVEDGVSSIGKYAFDGCNSLTSVTISNSVKSIESGSFQGCI